MRYGSLPIHSPNKVFFIGDIHGDLHRLEKLWAKIEEKLESNDHVVFLGDLINRLGLYSAEVLEFIRDLKEKYPGQIFCIEGNHDWMLKDFLVRGNMGWMGQYGKNTLQSFKRKYDLPDTNYEEIRDALEVNGILKFLDEMLPYYETESIIATHAPINWTTAMMHGLDDYEEYLEDDEVPEKRYLLDRFLYDIKWGFEAEERKLPQIEKLLVCGHQFKHHKQPRIFKERMFVDTGCGAVENRPLTAVMIPGKVIIQSD